MATIQPTQLIPQVHDVPHVATFLVMVTWHGLFSLQSCYIR